jgi:hypothetical protein
MRKDNLKVSSWALKVFIQFGSLIKMADELIQIYVAFCVKFLSENVNTVKKINLLRSQQ